MYQLLGEEVFHKLLLEAEKSPRKRSHLLLHDSTEDPVQQICIGFYSGSYVRPHQHPEANKWEHLAVLRGRILLLLFSQKGRVSDRIELAQGQGNSAISFPPNTWHTVIPLSPTAILIETKAGPYLHSKHSEFAIWAPLEGDEDSNRFVQWGLGAKVGDCYQ